MNRVITILLAGIFHLCAATIYAEAVRTAQSEASDLRQEWDIQYQQLKLDIAAHSRFDKISTEVFHPAALISSKDRDPLDVILRRTQALLDELMHSGKTARLVELSSALEKLHQAAEALPLANESSRKELYVKVCAIRRQVAFANPLLNFKGIVFTKHHRAIFEHMCDQYYGMAARPGGGVFVLDNPFSDKPSTRDILAKAIVKSGRLAGTKLLGGPNRSWNIQFDGMGNLSGETTEGGSFLNADLSYDGRTLVFSYVECTGDTRHRHHTDPSKGHWAEGRCYHVFRVNVDGTDLRQLTDGTWNEFAPCWLPNGRIAFISERRGGYLRCGRVCPNYTLHDMAADGSDIRCLSYHETNEWDPSVTHDGRIIYTRWDYVDRHGCTAHQPWITTLDGRDSRALHGNFSPRNSRPDMELYCRAIPGSTKYIATAAPHHGQAYGSLIVIDPQIADDDLMAPVKRLTPEIAFPESQGGQEVYGTPWPLSEKFYLCVYDNMMVANSKKTRASGNYGIYLVDCFGNRELLYRDPQIACLAPRPLTPRTKPAAVPELASNPGSETTIAVMNVYDSLKPWPENTKITHLRVLQTFAMSVPSGAPPHETGLRIATAGDSVNLVRHVLGTVPVESDGSAHFIVPPNREIFFQALDKDGLAVQSMRSATYLRPGEKLLCQGCHEPKSRTPIQPASPSLALRRPPSKMEPDVDGSNPFNYARLVQPVLDRNCVTCHEKNRDKAPNLGRDPIQRKWFASYNSLVTKFGFYDYGSPLRTTPGKFGAHASKLYKMINEGHHDLALSTEDKHRISLWLDCSSLFYGVYEKELGEAQLRGEVVFPTLD